MFFPLYLLFPFPPLADLGKPRGQSGHSRPPFSYGQVGKMVENKKKRQKINRKQEIKFLVEILHL